MVRRRGGIPAPRPRRPPQRCRGGWGYALNLHKTRSDRAREWTERSRQEIVGLWLQFALGTRVSDRNIVVQRDLSGLRPVHGRHGRHR